MLKIGTISWRGKCAKHPMYNPADGEAAIIGGCKRCQQLLEIRDSHRRTLELMKAFGPTREGRDRDPVPMIRLEDRQTKLF